MVLLSVFELSLIFWALSLMLLRLLLLLALLAIKLMMLNTERRRAMILKVLMSPLTENTFIIIIEHKIICAINLDLGFLAALSKQSRTLREIVKL